MKTSNASGQEWNIISSGSSSASLVHPNQMARPVSPSPLRQLTPGYAVSTALATIERVSRGGLTVPCGSVTRSKVRSSQLFNSLDLHWFLKSKLETNQEGLNTGEPVAVQSCRNWVGVRHRPHMGSEMWLGSREERDSCSVCILPLCIYWFVIYIVIQSRWLCLFEKLKFAENDHWTAGCLSAVQLWLAALWLIWVVFAASAMNKCALISTKALSLKNFCHGDSKGSKLYSLSDFVLLCIHNVSQTNFLADRSWSLCFEDILQPRNPKLPNSVTDFTTKARVLLLSKTNEMHVLFLNRTTGESALRCLIKAGILCLESWVLIETCWPLHDSEGIQSLTLEDDIEVKSPASLPGNGALRVRTPLPKLSSQLLCFCFSSSCLQECMSNLWQFQFWLRTEAIIRCTWMILLDLSTTGFVALIGLCIHSFLLLFLYEHITKAEYIYDHMNHMYIYIYLYTLLHKRHWFVGQQQWLTIPSYVLEAFPAPMKLHGDLVTRMKWRLHWVVSISCFSCSSCCFQHFLWCEPCQESNASLSHITLRRESKQSQTRTSVLRGRDLFPQSGWWPGLWLRRRGGWGWGPGDMKRLRFYSMKHFTSI